MKVLGLFLMLCGLTSLAMAQPAPVPEIDSGSATSAIALLAGGVMIWRAKRGK